MKIAIVIYHFSLSKGGVERAASNHVRELLRRGHEVHLFAHRFDPDDLAGKITYHRVPATTFHSSFKHLSFASNVKKMLAAEKMDIIHSFSRTYSQDVYRIGGGAHIEYLRHLGEEASGPLRRLWTRLNPKEAAILRLEKKGFAEGASKIITSVSHRCKEEVIRHFNVSPDRIRVIHNGVDLEYFHPSHRETEAKRLREAFGFRAEDILILFCGTGFRRKGLGSAIEAVASLPPSANVRLLVLGEGGVSAYRTMARRFKLAEKIFFLGVRKNVRDFYAGCDILIHPTLYDPFPNVCLEAMACGCPVITTAVAGVSEIIANGVDSFIVENGRDIGGIVKALKELMDGERRREMGRRARATAERYSVQRNVDENMKIYEEIRRMKGVGQ
ncbi:MAG: hypothetical protein A2Z34_02070 [Planctomycetes bacterium RBG_16_59_8]|nr:MAG: hypothetical protein A2Z34_02070 [Planctomycetes bacterium RBG_16_59_8]